MNDCTEPTRCRSCGADILWVQWAKSGKKMPVDAVSDNRAVDRGGGNIVLTLRKSENVLIAEKFNVYAHADRRRYTSHFSTCPNADEHRRG